MSILKHAEHCLRQVCIVEFTNGERKLQDVESEQAARVMTASGWPKRCTAVFACIVLSVPVWGADPGQLEVQRNQQLRQQQQDDLQLRMQQYQRSTQSPPGDARQQQSLRQLEVEQRQRQQQLHQQQNVEAKPVAPADDDSTQRAKAQIEQQRMQQERQQQLQRSDWELQQRAEQHKNVAPTR